MKPLYPAGMVQTPPAGLADRKAWLVRQLPAAAESAWRLGADVVVIVTEVAPDLGVQLLVKVTGEPSWTAGLFGTLELRAVVEAALHLGWDVIRDDAVRAAWLPDETMCHLRPPEGERFLVDLGRMRFHVTVDDLRRVSIGPQVADEVLQRAEAAIARDREVLVEATLSRGTVDGEDSAFYDWLREVHRTAVPPRPFVRKGDDGDDEA